MNTSIQLNGKFYCGIGSRRTPDDILCQMEALGQHAAAAGWTLRSGAARGADAAFEKGCDIVGGAKEIFIPWPRFNNHPSHLCHPASAAAYQLASTIHPNWKRLNKVARMLVSRNMHQVLGEWMIDPADCVVCYTPDGCESHTTYGIKTGGTGTAISAASRLGIPIFNLRNPGRLEDALEFMFGTTDEQIR